MLAAIPVGWLFLNPSWNTYESQLAEALVMFPVLACSVVLALVNIAALCRPFIRRQFYRQREGRQAEARRMVQHIQIDRKPRPSLIAVTGLAFCLFVGCVAWVCLVLGAPYPWLNRRITEDQLEFQLSPSAYGYPDLMALWHGMPSRMFYGKTLLWETQGRLRGAHLVYSPTAQQVEGIAGVASFPLSGVYYKLADGNITDGKVNARFPPGTVLMHQPEQGALFHEGIVIRLPNMPPRVRGVDVRRQQS